MGLSALYSNPDAAESQKFVIVHLPHLNNLHTLQVPRSMWDVHRIEIYSADEFDPIEHVATPQKAHLSAKFFSKMKNIIYQKIVYRNYYLEQNSQTRNVFGENFVLKS